MNLKQFMATGIVTTVLGLGPMIASAQEGPYFGVFLGKGTIDISRNDLNAIAAAFTINSGGTSPTGSSSLNDSDSIWGAQIGYRFNRWVAAEIGYVDLGKANYVADLNSTFTFPDTIFPPTDYPDGNYNYQARGKFTSSGPTAAVLGIFAIGDRFDIYGRGGIYFADTRLRMRLDVAATIVDEAKAGTQELFGGLGFQWNINDDFGVRAEGTYFLDVGDDDRTTEASIVIFGLGIVFR